MKPSNLKLQYLSQSQNASSKLAFMLSNREMNTMVNKYKIPPIKMKESLITLNIGFGFNANNFMYGLTEDVIEKLFPMGILQHWTDFNVLNSDSNVKKKKVPKVLKMDDLSFGFVLWLVACGVSCLCFLIEVGYSECWNALSSSIGLIFMLQILDIARFLRQ